MEKDTNPKDALGAAKWRQFMTVPRQVLWELGVAMLEGALKYGRHNYRASGVRASVYLDAAYGHLDQFCEGEDIDKDSGLSHITKAMASLAVLRDAMMNDFWVDDRPPKIKDLDGVRDFLQAKVAENFERYKDKNPHHYTQVNDGAPYHPKELRPEMFGEWPSMPDDEPGGLMAKMEQLSVEVIGKMKLDVGDTVRLEEDTGNYAKGTIFTVEAIGRLSTELSGVVLQGYQLKALDGENSGTWYTKLFSRVETFPLPEVGTLFDGPKDEDTLYDPPRSTHVIDLPGAVSQDAGMRAMFESLFGSFPDGYTMTTERVGDVEVTRIAPPEDLGLKIEDAIESFFAMDAVRRADVGGRKYRRGSDLEPGKRYQVAMTHNGVPVENGGVWDIVDLDDAGFPLGTKPTYFKGHPGMRLAASSWFVEVEDWNADDASFEDEKILRAAVEVDDLEEMRKQFAHAQSSTEALAPVVGLTRRAIGLLEKWREAEDGAKFAINVDLVSKAIALKQWALHKGIIL